MSFNFHYNTIIVPFSNLVFLNIVCSCVYCFDFAMATLSSATPFKRHSHSTAYFITELQEIKTRLAQRDEELRQMETKLQILDVKHMEKRLSKLAMKHERSIPHVQHHHGHVLRSSNTYGSFEKKEEWKIHKLEDRCQHVALPYQSVKVPSFSGDSDPNVYLDWEAKCEQIFKAYGVYEDQKVKISSLEFLDFAKKWWHSIVMDIGLSSAFLSQVHSYLECILGLSSGGNYTHLEAFHPSSGMHISKSYNHINFLSLFIFFIHFHSKINSKTCLCCF